MNATQKKFILNKLIPFMLREHGNGFAMDTWRSTYENNPEEIKRWGLEDFDDVKHKPPSCGTVACIGGSIQLLKKISDGREKQLANAIGLTEDQANGLFYHWDDGSADFGWPGKYINRFEKAKTPLAKAKVAVALLKEVVRTDGKCLERKNE
jgi:hypothetical protein